MNTTYERTNGNDVWLTPPNIIKALGEFDLDPCSPLIRPWDTAKIHFNQIDDGLSKPWTGRVWCNPPYGTETGRWLHKLADHGNGVAIVFARTETRMFFESVWGRADAILFFKGRLKFCTVDGVEGGSAGAPSCLVFYGKDNVDAARIALENGSLNGKLIILTN